MLSVDALTFDIGSTIVAPLPNARAHPLRAEALRRVLAQGGFPCEPAAVRSALEAAFDALDAAWIANVQYTAVQAADVCLARLELDVPAEVRAKCVSALQQASVSDAVLTPHVRDTLVLLKRAGIRLGVISDIFLTPGSGWTDFLAEREVAGLFDHWSFSDSVGAYKPARVIFDHAAAGLGVTDPARIAHVGDLRRTDVAGARQSGWRSVRYRFVDDDISDLPDADFVIDDHRELLAFLGL